MDFRLVKNSLGATFTVWKSMDVDGQSTQRKVIFILFRS